MWPFLDKLLDFFGLERKAPKISMPEFPVEDVIVRSLKFLHPELRDPLRQAIEECHGKGLMVYVFESYRTPARQRGLYEKGRTKPGKIVTRARPMHSWHNFGLAFDLVFDGDRRDDIQWSWDGDYNHAIINGDKRSDYERVGEVLEKYGFEWGARWKNFKEMPHFQCIFGLNTEAARRLHSSGGIKAVWAEVSRRAKLSS